MLSTSVSDSDHVSSVHRLTGISPVVLEASVKQTLVLRLFERLGVDVTQPAPWDRSDAPEGQLQTDGWKVVSTFVGAAPCLMFLDAASPVWKFKNGSDLLRVLKECPGLEFYVCDQEGSYLLCSNHHDFVIGWGRASSWVEDLATI